MSIISHSILLKDTALDLAIKYVTHSATSIFNKSLFFSVAKLQDECGEQVKFIYVFTGSNCVDKENCWPHWSCLLWWVYERCSECLLFLINEKIYLQRWRAYQEKIWRWIFIIQKRYEWIIILLFISNATILFKDPYLKNHFGCQVSGL